MKTKKVKFVIPVVAFMMAIGAAFATNASSSQEVSNYSWQGYIHNGPNCVSSIQCKPSGLQICTVEGSTQVFGMNQAGTKCNRILYKL